MFCFYMDLNSRLISSSSGKRSRARSSVAHGQAVLFAWTPLSAFLDMGEISVLGLQLNIGLQLSVSRRLFF